MTEREYNEREIREGRLTALRLLVILRETRTDLEGEVRTFQRLHGLKVDGCAGPKTQRAADRAVAAGGRLLPGPVYQPIWGACYWSGNLFRPGIHDGRDGFDGPKDPRKGWPNSAGATVGAIAAGEVVATKKIDNGWWVRIDHSHGVQSRYGHLEPRGVVRRGDVVAAAQQLGVLWADIHPPHIHHEIEVNGKLVEPVRFLEAHGAVAYLG